MNIMIIKFLMFSLCLILGIIFFISTFFFQFYLTFTIGRKFDKIFPYSPYGDNGKGFDAGVRAISYALYVVTKGKTIKNYSILAKQCYGDYDFNANVTPRQRKACWAYFICFISTFISFGLMCYFESLFHVHQI